MSGISDKLVTLVRRSSGVSCVSGIKAPPTLIAVV